MCIRDRYKPKLLVLDFGKVTFMDSSGVGLALGRYRLISQYNGQMRVDNTCLLYTSVRQD